MGKEPSQIRQEIEQTRAEIGETLEEVVHRGDVKERAKETVTEKVDSVKGKVSGAASRVEGKAKHGVNRLSKISEENPLGLVFGGVGLGLLAGLVAPSSRMEQQKLGPVAEELKGQAKKTGHEALERGKHVAEEAAHTAAETASEQGGQQAKELAGEAKQRAQKVASRASS